LLDQFSLGVAHMFRGTQKHASDGMALMAADHYVEYGLRSRVAPSDSPTVFYMPFLYSERNPNNPGDRGGKSLVNIGRQSGI
jgi:uncharacterized protein (DUF924 family)